MPGAAKKTTRKKAVRRPAKKAAKKGRPDEFDTARPKILRALKQGAFLNQAAAKGGIVYRTFRRWLVAGKAETDAVAVWEATPEEEREGDCPELTKFGRFIGEVELAEAQGEHSLVEKVSKKQPLEILKRRFPDRWGDKKTLAVQGGGDEAPPVKVEGGPAVVVNLTFEDPDDEDLWEMEEEEES